jgi:hypothetical protein
MSQELDVLPSRVRVLEGKFNRLVDQVIELNDIVGRANDVVRRLEERTNLDRIEIDRLRRLLTQESE